MEDSLDILEDSNLPPIKYLLIGNIDSNKIITEYSSTGDADKIKSEINQIFKRISKIQTKKFNERNKITSKDSIYYYTIEKPNLIFIILVDEEYPEDLVFELIDKIQKKEITKMINEEIQELNSKGRVELKNIIDIFQKKNLDGQNEKDNEDQILSINDTKKINEKEKEQNITENIEDLQTKTDEVLLTYNKKKWNIKDSQIFKNYKTWLYLAIIVLIILIFSRKIVDYHLIYINYI